MYLYTNVTRKGLSEYIAKIICNQRPVNIANHVCKQ